LHYFYSKKILCYRFNNVEFVNNWQPVLFWWLPWIDNLLRFLNCCSPFINSSSFINESSKSKLSNLWHCYKRYKFEKDCLNPLSAKLSSYDIFLITLKIFSSIFLQQDIYKDYSLKHLFEIKMKESVVTYLNKSLKY
jgi:hypothetical protein